MNASLIFADAGWGVTLLSAPVENLQLEISRDARQEVRTIRARKSPYFNASDYGRYLFAAARAACQMKPGVIYASDMLALGPAMLGKLMSGAILIYHEHDSPGPTESDSFLKKARRLLMPRADKIVFPNAERARIAADDLGLDTDQISVVWNVPRASEVPIAFRNFREPLILYYHGGITPDRLPLAVIDAVCGFSGRVRLRIAGYEAAGARGYLAELLKRSNPNHVVEYCGEIPLRETLLTEAARAHVGLAFMPRESRDINMHHMTGASNKAFDYMAAGLALMVSDLDDWQKMYAAPGYAITCDPADPASITQAIQWFLDHPAEREAMGTRGRAKIEADWNYESQFAPVLEFMEKHCAKI